MDTLVLKKDSDLTRQRFKKFKKIPLELYQKNYRVYKNELILTEKPTKTNLRTIENIYDKIAVEDEASKSVKGIAFQVKATKEVGEPSFAKQFDLHYNQSVNVSLTDRCTLHLDGSVDTKSDFSFYHMNSALSYRIGPTYYRLGMTWGPVIEYYLMASQKLSTNWSAGVLVSLPTNQRSQNNKLVTTIQYKNTLLYSRIGTQRTIGIKTYPIYNDNIKLFLNPYYGAGRFEGCSAGFSKKIATNTSLKLELLATPWMVQIKSSVLLRLNDIFKLFLSSDIQNTGANINVGLKIKDFYLGIPILTLDLTKKEEAVYLGPIMIAIVGLGIFWDRIRPKLHFLKDVKKNEITMEKRLEKRQKDLRLISRRVREIFVEETRKNGLVITEAYYGSKSMIDRVLLQPSEERFRSLQQEDYSSQVIDVTDPMRFYIDSSKLYLPKGSKEELYGIYNLNLTQDELPYFYIKYTYQGEEKDKFVVATDSIYLP